MPRPVTLAFLLKGNAAFVCGSFPGGLARQQRGAVRSMLLQVEGFSTYYRRCPWRGPGRLLLSIRLWHAPDVLTGNPCAVGSAGCAKRSWGRPYARTTPCSNNASGTRSTKPEKRPRHKVRSASSVRPGRRHLHAGSPGKKVIMERGEDVHSQTPCARHRGVRGWEDLPQKGPACKGGKKGPRHPWTIAMSNHCGKGGAMRKAKCCRSVGQGRGPRSSRYLGSVAPASGATCGARCSLAASVGEMGPTLGPANSPCIGGPWAAISSLPLHPPGPFLPLQL